MDAAQMQWVFGYGSLIWNPGFMYERAQVGTLVGLHRGLCVYSFRHRGTEAAPGLVFGLMRGGSCRGMAFGVDGEGWEAVQAYLRAREMDRGVYKESWRQVRLDDGRVVEALAFVVDPRHRQFAGRLPVEEQVRLVRQGHGESGDNIDYVLATAARLAELGMRDKRLDRLVTALSASMAADGVD